MDVCVCVERGESVCGEGCVCMCREGVYVCACLERGVCVCVCVRVYVFQGKD